MKVQSLEPLLRGLDDTGCVNRFKPVFVYEMKTLLENFESLSVRMANAECESILLGAPKEFDELSSDVAFSWFRIQKDVTVCGRDFQALRDIVGDRARGCSTVDEEKIPVFEMFQDDVHQFGIGCDL